MSLFYLLCRNQSPPRLTCQQPLTSLMIQCWSGCVVCAANGSQRLVLSSLKNRRFFRIFQVCTKRTWRARHSRCACLAGVSRSPSVLCSSVLQAKFYHGYFLFHPCNVSEFFFKRAMVKVVCKCNPRSTKSRLSLEEIFPL